jgi:hypothetical protein
VKEAARRVVHRCRAETDAGPATSRWGAQGQGGREGTRPIARTGAAPFVNRQSGGAGMDTDAVGKKERARRPPPLGGAAAQLSAGGRVAQGAPGPPSQPGTGRPWLRAPLASTPPPAAPPCPRASRAAPAPRPPQTHLRREQAAVQVAWAEAAAPAFA